MAITINMPTGEFTAPKDSEAHFDIENPFAEIRGAKSIIFDLGGVVIDLRREAAIEALQALGVSDADNLLGLYRQQGPFLMLETGQMHAGEFFDTLRRECPGADDRQLTDAFNAFLIGIPTARLKRLRQLRDAGYHLYVLSNTNPVMYNSWIDRAFRAENLTINDYFDGIVVSFQELTCKPDPEIFSRLLRRYRLNAVETVMLDDSAANCEAARSVGMTAIQVGNTPDSDMLAITSPCLFD